MKTEAYLLPALYMALTQYLEIKQLSKFVEEFKALSLYFLVFTNLPQFQYHWKVFSTFFLSGIYIFVFSCYGYVKFFKKSFRKDYY